MSNTTKPYTCQCCENEGVYRKNYGVTLCDECVKYDIGRTVGTEITKKYLKRRS